MFALIDGNSFYCSCERAFDAKLRGKPVVVLSNNDGCAIARTAEAKALGIGMGEPYHLARRRPGLEAVIWKSSNYALYGDMSRRMFEVLAARAPHVEPYSIDEMFLDFRGIAAASQVATDLRMAVLKEAKIPTCVGIGPTKTIAKLANRVAKDEQGASGVCDLRDMEVRRVVYATLPVEKVWGIGPAATAKLAALGVSTIGEFLALSDDVLRQNLTVTGLRTAWELRGRPCLSLATAVNARKSLAVTRSFGRAVEDWEEMEQAVSAYATRAGERLRRHGLVAGAMQVFLHTNRFSAIDRQYGNQASFTIEPTADGFALMAAAVAAARRLWRDGYRYAKAGVILLELRHEWQHDPDLFPSRDPQRSKVLMATMDGLNRRFGRMTISPGSVRAQPVWGMRRGNVSPCYTTRFEEMLEVSVP